MFSENGVGLENLQVVKVFSRIKIRANGRHNLTVGGSRGTPDLVAADHG
jgi:hypothetical protein